jgi:hypothetical protein
VSHLTEIRHLVRRVRWRLRLQRAAWLLVWAIGGTLLAAAGVVALAKLGWLPAGGMAVAVGFAGFLGLVALVGGVARRVGEIDAAQRLDRAGSLHDRLGSALAFASKGEPSALEKLAIEDAARVLREASPKQAAPWSLPTNLVWVTPPLVLALLAMALPPLVAGGVGHAVPPLPTLGLAQPKAPKLDKQETAELKEEAEKLQEEIAKTEDPTLQKWIAALNELIRELELGKLTLAEAHAKLAELERAREKWVGQVGEGYDEVAKKLKQAAEKQKPKNQTIDPLLDAFRQEAWKRAAQALEHTAEALDKGQLDEKARNDIAKNLQNLAQAIETERQRQEKQAQKERDRLKQKEQEQKDRFSPKDRDRLKENERQLAELRREAAEMSEMRRQLEQLQRNLDKAAQDLMKRLAEGAQPMSAEELRQAAELLKRMQQQGQGMGQLRLAEGRMIDLKEILRRAGEQPGEGEGQGQGKDGKGNQRRDFLVLAKGKPGGQKPGQGQGQGDQGEGKEGSLLMPGKDGKDGGLVMLGGGEGKPGGALPMPGPGGNDPSAEQGEGIGMGHDPTLQGERTRLAGTKFDEQHAPAPALSEGETESNVVEVAARAGFASRSYRKVHQDYSKVVEDTLQRQEIPPGSRRYVRRYFDLIRPR